MSESATIERLEHRIGLLTEAVTKLARIDGARLSRARIPESQSTPSTEVRRGPWRYRGNFGRQIRRAVVRCAGVTFP